MRQRLKQVQRSCNVAEPPDRREEGEGQTMPDIAMDGQAILSLALSLASEILTRREDYYHRYDRSNEQQQST